MRPLPKQVFVSNTRTLVQLDEIGEVWGGTKRTEVIDRLVEREYTRMRDSGELQTQPSVCRECGDPSNGAATNRVESHHATGTA